MSFKANKTATSESQRRIEVQGDILSRSHEKTTSQDSFTLEFKATSEPLKIK